MAVAMSIWRYIFDSDWIQRSDIEALRAQQARQAKTNTAKLTQLQKLEKQIQILEEEVSEAAMALRGMKELLLEKAVFSPADLEEKLSQLSTPPEPPAPAPPPPKAPQTQPGSAPRQVKIVRCPACDGKNSPDRVSCIYCGARLG